MKLKAPANRVIIKVDLESKNSHTFKEINVNPHKNPSGDK